MPRACDIWRSVRRNCLYLGSYQSRGNCHFDAAADGCNRLVWLLTFLNGKLLAEVHPHTPELLGDSAGFWGAGRGAAVVYAPLHNAN